MQEADRERLGGTFEAAAELYQRARPDYPGVVYERLLQVTSLTPPARLVEVGCASGKATLPLARLGFPIVAIEPGAALAAAARRNTTGLDVTVMQTRFEDWSPDRNCDLVYAATSWHWVDPAVRYQRAADALRPEGFLAVWSAGHVIPEDGDPFFEQIQEVYNELGEDYWIDPAAPLPRPGQLPDLREEIQASGLFEVVHLSQFDWETIYDADGYIDLLNTFSGHIAMAAWQRDRLYGEVRRRLAERRDGTLRRHWGGVLHIGRLRTDGLPVPRA
jgi:SAM-dependent methyltransferase